MSSYSRVLYKVIKSIEDCDFLNSQNVEVGDDFICYYPASGVFTMTSLAFLISIAEKFKLHYYVCSRNDEIYFRLYKV